MRIKIQNGHVIDPANQIDAKHDIFIADGKILAVGKAPENFQAEKIIDAKNQIVCPGLIDLSAHVHPGQETITVESETAAAASAGITTLCCPPDTIPIIDNIPVVEWLQIHAKQIGKTRVLPLGAMTQQLRGTQISDMATLKSAGCIAVSDSRSYYMDTALRRRCFEYAKTFDIPVFLNAQDYSLAKKGFIHEGETSMRLGIEGIPETAETIGVACDILLIEQTGVKAHFCRVSTKTAMKMIALARERGLPITADVAIHQLFLTDSDVTYDSNYYVLPPLRTENDRSGLEKAVIGSEHVAICSDHTPLDLDAKRGSLTQTMPGISALETLLPLTLKFAQKTSTPLSQALRWITQLPGDVLGVAQGKLSVGATADICIFDPKHRWIFKSESILSHGKNSPFLNQEFAGKVVCTLVDGKIIFQI